jgi:hypothetical protein
MKKKKSFYDYIGMTCYKYAPESFKAYAVIGFSNGNKNIPLYKQIKLMPDEISICGNAFCCNGRKAALKEVKKIIRTKLKNRKQYCTIGFLDTENKKQFYFQRELSANIYDLDKKLYIYKEFKRYMLSKNCKIEAYTMATLDGHFQPENMETKYNYVDINKPVMVKFKESKNYVIA